MDKEDVTIRDENLNEITRMTLQGEVDMILKKKEPLGSLKDIFHYQNEPCPRVILIMGAPGEYGGAVYSGTSVIQVPWDQGWFISLQSLYL